MFILSKKMHYLAIAYFATILWKYNILEDGTKVEEERTRDEKVRKLQ